MAAPKSDLAAIRQTIRALRSEGYELESVYDGGELIDVSTETEALDAIDAVDGAVLHVEGPGSVHEWIYFVLGNDPEEVINDYTVGLEPVLGPLIKKWWD